MYELAQDLWGDLLLTQMMSQSDHYVYICQHCGRLVQVHVIIKLAP